MMLGELIGVARELKGWSLRDLEKISGVSRAVISKIENHTILEPRLSTVVRLVDALGIPLDRAAEPLRAVDASHQIGVASDG